MCLFHWHNSCSLVSLRMVKNDVSHLNMKSSINNNNSNSRGSLNKLSLKSSSSNISASCYKQKLSFYKRENRQKAPLELCVPIVDNGSESFDVKVCCKDLSAALVE